MTEKSKKESDLMTFKDRVRQALGVILAIGIVVFVIVLSNIAYTDYKAEYDTLEEETTIEFDDLYIRDKKFIACVDDKCYRSDKITISDATYIKLTKRSKLNVFQFIAYRFMMKDELHEVEIYVHWSNT